MDESKLSLMKVLVVEDARPVRKSIVRLLKEIGFMDVDEAEDGSVAVDMLNKSLRSIPYDLFLCDINMPEMNGIELVKHIRDIDSYFSTPIIMISTENERLIILDSIAAGANNYILKPFTVETVLDKLKAVLT